MNWSVRLLGRYPAVFLVGLLCGIIGLASGVVISWSWQDRFSSMPEGSIGPSAKMYAKQVSQDESSQFVESDSICANLGAFENVSDFSSRLARTLQLQRAFSGMELNTLVKCLNETTSVQSKNLRDEILQLIFRRIAVLDPEVAIKLIDDFAVTQLEELTIAIYGEWSFFDLASAIEHARTLSNKKRRAALTGLLLARDDLTESKQHEIAKQLGFEDVAVDLLAMSKTHDSVNNPKESWDTYVSQDLSQDEDLTKGQVELLSNIGIARIEQEGLPALKEMEESIGNSEAVRRVFSGMVWILIDDEPSLALDVALGVPSPGYPHIPRIVVESWAEGDPFAALNAAGAIKKQGIRKILQDIVLEQWAKSDAIGLLSSSEHLPTNLSLRCREAAMVELAQVSPITVYDMLDDLSTQESKLKVLEAIVASMAVRDLSAAIDWIQSETRVQRYQDRLTEAAIQHLSLVDPYRAFQDALEQPLADSQVGLEATVISSLSHRSTDIALELFSNIRNNTTRLVALGSLVEGLLFAGLSEQALEVTLQTIEGLPVDARIRSMFWNLAWQAPEVLYSSIDQLESEELRTHVAKVLLDHNADALALSEDQLENLRKYAPERIRTSESLKMIDEALELVE